VTSVADKRYLHCMAIFRRKGAVAGAVVDLRTPTDVTTCPTCGAPGSTDYVDLVLQKALHTCRRCARLWESPAHHAAR
jgi:Zn finger protein HypA/HybF involved in hydrogenase expression